ncbi:hypothetical protein GVN21_16890, partial [Caulobacter sp. SLTY]|uniref:hypothetical protein n=1 Tax=Caulobacter sp. SLTY TaxID=2683262 RepID=UPI001412A079
MGGGDTEARARFKATRPVYRRGGLLLNSATWVIAQAQEIELKDVLALVEDPNVVIELETEVDAWAKPPAGWRVELAGELRRRLDGKGAEEAEEEPGAEEEAAEEA